MPPKSASSRGEYIETETGNKISRRATILGPKHIMLAGKCVIQENVVVHGDLVRPSQPKPTPAPSKDGTDRKEKPTNQEATSVHLGRYVFISAGCALHPPSRTTISTNTASTTSSNEQATTVVTYYPLRISDHVYIGPNTVVRAAEIRGNVHIGSNCAIGNMVLIKDNVRILDGSVLPANSVWASGSVVGGSPARVVGDLGEAWGGSSSATGGGGEEGVGVKSRERWASVGNKR